eukprot:g10023.t1
MSEVTPEMFTARPTRCEGGWLGNGFELWQDQYLKPYSALNLGIGGDEVQHVLWRVQQGALDNLDPLLLVLMIGTNNIGNSGHKAQQIAEGIQKLLQELTLWPSELIGKAKLPRTRFLLLGVLPRDQAPGSALRREVLELNRLLASLEDGKMVDFLDLGEHFLTSEGVIAQEIMEDFLHLSPKGYAIWAEKMQNTLRRAAPPTSLPMRGSLRQSLGRWKKKAKEPEEPTQELIKAADWLLTADALVIGSGAGLSQYGGQPTFQGPSGWGTYADLPLEEVFCARCFEEDPPLAWGMWGAMLRFHGNLHTSVFKPYKQVENYAKRAPLGAYCMTTTVDGAWLKIGWPRSALLELHGNTGLLSCCKGCQFWETPENLSSERPASCAARASENRGGVFWGVLKEVEAG